MHVEIDALEQNQTWTLTSLLPGKKDLSSKCTRSKEIEMDRLIDMKFT